MNAILWFKILRLWLKPHIANDEVIRLRAQEERIRLLEMRKAAAAAWYYPPLCKAVGIIAAD
jgi:hypothetical protein